MAEKRNVRQAVVDHAKADLEKMPNASQPRIVEVQGDSVRGAIREWWENLHVGAGHAQAMLRLGAHELTQALAAFPDSNIRPLEEPGVVGNATPQIVTEQMGHDRQDAVQDVPQYNPKRTSGAETGRETEGEDADGSHPCAMRAGVHRTRGQVHPG